MKHLIMVISCLSLLVFLTSCVSYNTCSGEQMTGMKEKGFSVDEIKNMCTGYKLQEEAVKAFSQTASQALTQTLQKRSQQDAGNSQEAAPPSAPYNAYSAYNSRPPAATARTCSTQFGSCMLMEPGYSGAPCACFTPFGQIPGVAM